MSPFARWITAVGACCVLAATVFVGGGNDFERCPFGVCPGEPFGDLRIRRAVARQHERITWLAMRAEDDLARARRVFPGPASTGEPELWFAPDVPDVARQSVRRALDAERASRGTWHGRGRVAVMTIVDTGRRIAGHDAPWSPSSPVNTRVLLPSLATSGRCVTVIRVRGVALLKPYPSSPEHSLLDACAFFDAFGPPGASIAAALDSGAFQSARQYLPAARDSVRRVRHRMAFLAGTEPDGLTLYRCVAGSDAGCDDLVADLVSQRSGTFEWYGRAPSEEARPVTAETMPTSGGALFDAIAADIGPERFERFWRSDAIVTSAYRAIAGRSITVLARAKARETFPIRAAVSAFGIHATRATSATAGSTALVILAIVACAWVASRGSRRPTSA